MKLKTFAAALAATTIAGSAFAADLPSRKVAPAYVAPAPVFTWTGFYIGANIGYGFGAGTGQNGSWVYPGFAVGGAWNTATNPNGILGGLTAGYNWQMSPMMVVGLETDIQASGIRASRQFTGPGFPAGTHTMIGTSSNNVGWFGTLRGRLGVAVAPTFLVYATGGLAYGKVSQSLNMVDMSVAGVPFAATSLSGSTTRVGWTVGAGGEYAFSQNWSAKLEYLYTNLGKLGVAGASVAIAAPVPYVFNQSPSNAAFHTIRAGLNYRFGGAAGPVVAKY